jgi:hypothetical protein
MYVKDHSSIKKIFLIARWTRYSDGNYQGKEVGYLGTKATDPLNIETSGESLKKSLKYTIEVYQKIGVKIYIVFKAPNN